MSTLGYGMYGYNVLNPNGETDSLPICRLSGGTAQLAGFACLFSEVADEYCMVVPNQSTSTAYYSAIRTPVSGLYEIEYRVTATGGGGAGVGEADIYVDKATSFTSNGTFSYNSTGGAYQVGLNRQSTPASTAISFSQRTVLFLEKDCYLTVTGITISGTAATYGGGGSDYFLVRCISTENSNKLAVQS